MNKWTVGLLALIATAFFVVVCFMFKKQNEEIKNLKVKISHLEKNQNRVKKSKVIANELNQDEVTSEEFSEPTNANDVFKNLLSSFGNGNGLLHFTSKAMMPIFNEMGKKSAQITEIEQDDCDIELDKQLREIEDLISETEINE